jgi:hypothetical protein
MARRPACAQLIDVPTPKSLLGLVLAAAVCGPAVAGAPPANAAKVGVLVTGWGTVEGNSPEYNAELYQRAFLGERATAPDQPCTELFFGEYPYRAELGQVPFAVAFKVPGYEPIWDGSGVYRRRDDGAYVSILDPKLVLTAADVGAAKIIPAREIPFGGRAFFFTPDPRDGTDHLAGYHKIFKPNGLPDAFEQATLGAIRRDALMGYGSEPPRLYKFQADLERYITDYTRELFGKRAEVRFGYYASIPGLTRLLEDVAAEFARDGFRQLVIARDTTDRNFYANVVWDRNHTIKGLCRAGFAVGEDGVQLRQVPQVGRTPEYNTMLVRNLAPHFSRIAPGSEVSIVYATHGYPFPGSQPVKGPMAKARYEIAETFHESAYLNFLSFREYVRAAYDVSGGGRYRVNFARSGGTGSDHARTRNLFAYAHVYEPLIGLKDDPLRFGTVRNTLEHAIFVDRRREIIIVLSHWYKNSNNTAVEIRELNKLPLNTIADMRKGIYSITWCERYRAPSQFEQYAPGSDGACNDGDTRIQLTEAFDPVANEFFIGYANRIRGGIEQFGVLPDLDLKIAASGPITAREGGIVSVTEGTLAGARLLVRPDPQPGMPEQYSWERAFRPASHASPNTGTEALRPINEYQRVEDFLDGATDDFTALIGIQRRSSRERALRAPPRAVSPVVYFGPYRTPFNAPAEITLPYDRDKAAKPERIAAYVYNEITQQYDPVFPVPGGRPLRVDRDKGHATFDVQVLGNFVLIGKP